MYEHSCTLHVKRGRGYSKFIQGNDYYFKRQFVCYSTEGKQKIACVLTAVDTCPDLMTSGNYATMLQSLQTVKQMGGVEGMCSIIQGGVIIKYV
jgi:hypothetical protein